MIDLRGSFQLPCLSHESLALLAVGKFFGRALGRFRLLMPVLFYGYFAGHGSLPDVLKAGVFSEICAYKIIHRPAGSSPKFPDEHVRVNQGP